MIKRKYKIKDIIARWDFLVSNQISNICHLIFYIITWSTFQVWKSVQIKRNHLAKLMISKYLIIFKIKKELKANWKIHRIKYLIIKRGIWQLYKKNRTDLHKKLIIIRKVNWILPSHKKYSKIQII